MRVDVSFKYLKKSAFVDNVVENNLKKIRRRIQIFRQSDPIHISVHVEKNPHKDQFFCRSHLYLPTSKVLIADEKAGSASLAINKAFSAISRQLDKEKHKKHSPRRRLKKNLEPEFE
ncbi:MAG: HPF/RaiA family ribosome-associated protein [Candidatus Omnitrophica bacterium]|nr:HPF/RaiA family ribosome-associated protein [Candidatus Omnitrophota bacterium]